MNENNDLIKANESEQQPEQKTNRTEKIICYIVGAILCALTVCVLVFLLFMIRLGVTLSAALGGFGGLLFGFLNQ